MFYETAQTVGPGWHRSFKPSHYEDMSWSPSSRNFRSPGSSPETYRRIIRSEDEFPDRGSQQQQGDDDDDEFFRRGGRRSPTFPRRIFKEVWSESPSSNPRFGDRPRLFKRVFRPNHFEDEPFERDSPHLRRFEREFDRNFDDSRRKHFDEDFEKHFERSRSGREESGHDDDAEARIHHIPIMVERRMEDLKSRFNEKPQDEEEEEEGWSGPQVHRLRRAFEPESGFATRHRSPKPEGSSMKSRMFANIPESWDPQAVHTLPTRKMHKASQSFEDCRHAPQSKNVFRSNSETNEDLTKPSQQHSTAFRSHSDGHCPKQTYVTKIEVGQQPSGQDGPSEDHSPGDLSSRGGGLFAKRQTSQSQEEGGGAAKGKGRGKFDSPALQQIAAVLQNVEDLVTRIENYGGTGRDKQFRFLDEMLTRCMLRLDDIDTEGREDVRNARKSAIRQVQNCIDRLEAKAEESERSKPQRSEDKENMQTSEEQPVQGAPKTAAIPLGDVPKSAVPSSSPNPPSCGTAIPLGDSSNTVIPLAGTVIPLGDVPKPAIPPADASCVAEKSECPSSDPGDAVEAEKQGRNGNIEQTKL